MAIMVIILLMPRAFSTKALCTFQTATKPRSAFNPKVFCNPNRHVKPQSALETSKVCFHPQSSLQTKYFESKSACKPKRFVNR